MSDNDTKMIDAMCLIECLDFGDCKELYKTWDHGIYEFRDRVSILAEFAHECWSSVSVDGSICFDSEFCPEWLAGFMRLGMYDTEFLTVATGRRIAREIKSDRDGVTISKSDLNHLIELAEIRRDMWNGEPCDISDGDSIETKSFHVGLISELIDRVTKAKV